MGGAVPAVVHYSNAARPAGTPSRDRCTIRALRAQKTPDLFRGRALVNAKGVPVKADAYFLSEAASRMSPRFIISLELSRLSASKEAVSAASWSVL